MNTRWFHVDGHGDKWYICWPDGSVYAGPYKTAPAAKGQLTRILKL